MNINNFNNININDWASCLEKIVRDPKYKKVKVQSKELCYETTRALTFQNILDITDSLLRKNKHISEDVQETISQCLNSITKQKIQKVTTHFGWNKSSKSNEYSTLTEQLQKKLPFVQSRLTLEQIKSEVAQIEQEKDASHKSTQFFDSIFALSKELRILKKQATNFNLRQSIYLPNTETVEGEIVQLEEKLKSLAPTLLSATEIAKNFGEDALKTPLEETLNSILEEIRNSLPEDSTYHINEHTLSKEAKLFKCSQLEVKMMYAKRQIKAQKTGMSLPLIAKVENTWQKIMHSKDQRKCNHTKEIEGHIVSFMPKAKRIYLIEECLGEGSFKAALSTTLFLTVKEKSQRGNKVILLSKDAHIVKRIKGESGSNESGTMVVNSGSQTNKNPLTKKEIDLSRELGSLPGIWTTDDEIVEVDGEEGILQDKAGLKVTLKTGEEVVCLDLYHMYKLFKKDLLTTKDQIIYLDRIHDFLKGVQSLHEHNVIHRDLKPENVLVNEMKAGIADFGIACKTDDSTEKEVCTGTPDFMAPEVCRNLYLSRDIGTEADIWGVGAMLWTLLLGVSRKSHPALQLAETLSNDEYDKKILKSAGLEEEANNSEKIYTLLHLSHLLTFQNQGKYKNQYLEPEDKNSMAHLVWQCARLNSSERPKIDSILAIYELWLNSTKKKLLDGEISSIKECFGKVQNNAAIKVKDSKSNSSQAPEKDTNTGTVQYTTTSSNTNSSQSSSSEDDWDFS